MPDTYEEFSEEMSSILSSGSVFEMSPWHKNSIAKLIDGMDRDSVVMQLNLWYAGEDPSDLREGELGTIAELVSNLEPNRDKVTVEFKVVFE